MRVAITAQGNSLSSGLDPRFGRALYFIILDTDSGTIEVVNNEQNMNALQGAGIQAAKTIVDNKVNAVITGHCGPNAFRALSTAGVKVYLGQTGTIQDVIDKLKNGELTESSNPDVQGHWT